MNPPKWMNYSHKKGDKAKMYIFKEMLASRKQTMNREMYKLNVIQK